jgi:hypothetical protein
MLAMTLAKWIGVFLVGFSSAVFNMIAGLFLLVAVLSYLMGLATGPEVLKMILIGFGIFLVPIVGEAAVTTISAVNARLRAFIRS